MHRFPEFWQSWFWQFLLDFLLFLLGGQTLRDAYFAMSTGVGEFTNFYHVISKYQCILCAFPTVLRCFAHLFISSLNFISLTALFRREAKSQHGFMLRRNMCQLLGHRPPPPPALLGKSYRCSKPAPQTHCWKTCWDWLSLFLAQGRLWQGLRQTLWWQLQGGKEGPL